MGRPGLTRHVKFRRLASDLGSKLIARGALEMLWDTVYETGDPNLGDSRGVELAAEWDGAPGVLTAALLSAGGNGSAGFIEETSEGQYAIHDLWDHAPDYVRKRRSRENERKEKGSKLRSMSTTDRSMTGQCPPNGNPPAPAPAPKLQKESPAALAGDGRDLVLVPPPPKQERTRKARPQRDMADSDKVIAAFREGYKKRTGGIAQIALARDRSLANAVIDQQGLELAISYAYEFGYNPPRDNRDKGFCDFCNFPRAISRIQDRRKECGL